ncbi:uncharacterized protein FMAN_09810 [Fusarium mangiferae]|uniref:Uncharacterized protein n=1 Tax=Fusarium mangiferae TaxID=192010 RepID=A0A1L7TQX0_FUSMA|nr:uncharacterized protein FMAN_09810 [Fusarium mangiferae]CVL00319.1 uncharacterized protein FMAN_09810 [Fusarium mangiferae]
MSRTKLNYILQSSMTRMGNTTRRLWALASRTVETGYSPWGVWECTAKNLLQAPQSQQNEVFQHFLHTKQRELEIVIISSVLVATLVGSLMSWNWFPVPPYTAKIAMLCALIHALLGTSIATQQFLIMAQISISPQRNKALLCAILGSDASSFASPMPRPRRLTSVSWQAPTMLLGNSIVFLLVGIAIHIYDAARSAGIWGADMVTALCFTISLIFAVTTYFIHWVALYWVVNAELQA